MENTRFESFDIPLDTAFDTTSLNSDFFDFSSDSTLANFSSNNNIPTATAIPQQQNNNNCNNLLGRQQHTNNVPFSHPMIQDHQQFVQNNSFPIGGGTRNFDVGSSSMQGQNQNQNQNQNFFGSENYNEIMPLSFWPPNAIPFFCSCCHVLREIIHTNGTNFEKLEIHGTLGTITHAIHHHNIPAVGSSNTVQFEMIDLTYRNGEEIKTFIRRYCEEQTSTGYFMVQDPLSSYYEALCTGMEWIEDVNDDLNANEMEQEVDNNNGSGTAENNGTAPSKPTLAQQRERASKMKLTDFSDYFHLPIGEASKKLSICPTVVKKICRKQGLQRWPHRKVKSLARQMEIMRRALVGTVDPFSRMRTQGEINRLESQMIQYCAGVAPTAIDYDELMKDDV